MSFWLNVRRNNPEPLMCAEWQLLLWALEQIKWNTI
jgi:hypothetical protein